MSKKTKNKNDVAWEKIFDEYKVLNQIEKNGYFEIESKTINEVRQARLMAKFDHRVDLPLIFKKNQLSILPISRYKYILGKFNAYADLNYDKNIKPIEVSFPDTIQTIDRNNIYSESVALSCAYATGMIDDLLGEITVPTVSGRMGSQSFDFDITMNTSEANKFNIQVKKAQLEIDGGFEGNSGFLLVEAKNESINDFLVRQLYYPYRLWQKKIEKPVIPTFFTFSNDVFSFFIYEFEDINHYNSLKLIKQKDYILAHEEITLDDIFEVMQNVKMVYEPSVPFPQANSFKRVVDFLSVLANNEGSIDKETLAATTTFNVVVSRQLDYYTTAAIYLGLVERERRNGQTVYSLTKKGASIMKMPYKEKYLGLASSILEHRIFLRVLHAQLLNAGNPIDKAQIVKMMREEKLYGIDSERTFKRRASTIQAWVDWILSLQDV
jgi:hypothetical protein